MIMMISPSHVRHIGAKDWSEGWLFCGLVDWFGWRTHDDFHAGEGGVVLAAALLAVHVAEAIRVVLLELLVVHHLVAAPSR